MFGLFKTRRHTLADPVLDSAVVLGEHATTTALRDENEAYWNEHNVTVHARFHDAEASLTYFDWRNAQYYNYLPLMPVAGQDDKVVLDYGCGPGNDLVGFGHYSRPTRLIGADISLGSLREARARLALHDIAATLLHVGEHDERLPLADHSVDYIHSSGVVHHAQDPAAVLREFRRVLRPSGTCRIMVYNYDSLWLHLYVAYVLRLKEGLYVDRDLRGAFARSTDGENCPIARVYRPDEFSELAASAGFRCRFLGAAISMWEMTFFPQRFEAIMRTDFAAEHRNFLLELTLDPHGYPLYHGHYAGIDGCYELRA